MPVHIRLFLTLPLTSITLLVLLSSGPAYAEWVQIDTTDEGMSTYVDPTTIRRKGDLVKMWHMFDEKIADNFRGSTFLSIRAQNEYDCAEERSRRLASSYHSGNMGSGKVVATSDESKWASVAPRSVGQALWAFACDKQ